MDPSHVDPDSFHHGHHNTDSMVTVSLSDVPSNSDPSHPDWRSIPQTPVDNAPDTDTEGDTAPHALKSEPDPIQDQAVPAIQSPQDEIDQEDAENDVVDWAELERTEEQEPKTEQSDEVCCLLSRKYSRILIGYSQLPYYSLD